MDGSWTISCAYVLAVNDLRACYNGYGIVAGRHHYDDYWTRDAGFAWLAALQLGDRGIVQRHLAFLSHLQKKDGMIPFLVRQYLSPLSMLGVKIKTRLKPKFRSHKALWLSNVIDSNSWFLIGLASLAQTLGSDWYFASASFPGILPALSWCERQIGADGLVREGFLAGWNDGILKSGKTLLNNVLFYRALSLWGDHNPVLGEVAERIKEALQRDFFNGQYFIDWIDRRGRRYDYFESIGSFLAILWGIADEAQAQSIADFAFEHAYDPRDRLVKISYPDYTPSLADPGNRVMGLGEYWGGNMYWLEPSLLFVQALSKMGRKSEARQVLENVAEIICKYRGVYEVYEWVKNPDKGTETLKPVNRWNYRSEHPFTRSAGLFILSCRELGCV